MALDWMNRFLVLIHDFYLCLQSFAFFQKFGKSQGSDLLSPVFSKFFVSLIQSYGSTFRLCGYLDTCPVIIWVTLLLAPSLSVR